MPLPRALARAMAMGRIGRASALAYRGELVLWMLTTTMPLVLLALWRAVAKTGALGRFDAEAFSAWFLGAIVVRTATMSWIVWDIEQDVRHGTLDRRLLRPMYVLGSYAAEAVGAFPVRVLLAAPIAVGWLAIAHDRLTTDPLLWLMAVVAVVGAALLTIASMTFIGMLALRIGSALGVYDLWLAAFFVLSGYSIPLELLPAPVAHLAAVLPFRMQLSLPVETAMGLLSRSEAFAALGIQAAWALGLFALAHWAWVRGMRTFTGQGG